MDLFDFLIYYINNDFQKWLNRMLLLSDKNIRYQKNRIIIDEYNIQYGIEYIELGVKRYKSEYEFKDITIELYVNEHYLELQNNIKKSNNALFNDTIKLKIYLYNINTNDNGINLYFLPLVKNQYNLIKTDIINLVINFNNNKDLIIFLNQINANNDFLDMSSYTIISKDCINILPGYAVINCTYLLNNQPINSDTYRYY